MARAGRRSFGGCQVRRDRILTSVASSRRVEDGDLDDPRLAKLICESYREIGAQGRLRAGHSGQT